MVIVTGSSGFIGSQVANRIVTKKPHQLVLVDKVDRLKGHRYFSSQLGENEQISAEDFLTKLPELHDIELIIHLGAITNTAETDLQELQKWNVEYSKAIWNHCTRKQIPLIYATSAATYGDGTMGFSDDHGKLAGLKPLNSYGKSKHEFDLFALKEKTSPPHWYGLKFFNVYGLNEFHKGRMASAIFHGFNEIQDSGSMTLFRSHNPRYKDGDQARDFIYINDILNIIEYLRSQKPENGIYNCGSGRAGTFLELAHHLFEATGKPPRINWVDTPPEFRKAYQYKTEAEMGKLISTGYRRSFTPLAEGVQAYVSQLLEL